MIPTEKPEWMNKAKCKGNTRRTEMRQRNLFIIGLIVILILGGVALYVTVKGDCEIFRYSSIKDVPARCNKDFKVGDDD